MELFLEQHGTHLSVRNGLFLIEHEERTLEVSPEQVRTIWVVANCRISSAAMLLAVEHEIALVITRNFQPSAMVWSAGYGSIATIRRKQALFACTTLADKLSARLIEQKISRGILLLKNNGITTDLVYTQGKQLGILEEAMKRIRKRDFPQKAQLRGVEGHAMKTYFALYKSLLPEHIGFSVRKGKGATDPANMALNYLYGMLYKEVELALLKAGLDPYLGFFHAHQHNRPTLVYDCIEQYRPWADESLLLAWHAHSSSDKMHTEALSKEWRRALASTMCELLETPEPEGAKEKRRNVIVKDAISLAAYLKKLPDERLLAAIRHHA